MIVIVSLLNVQAMESEIYVEIYQPELQDSQPRQHSLGFDITSAAETMTSEHHCCDADDSGCFTEDDTGTGSSSSDSERAEVDECTEDGIDGSPSADDTGSGSGSSDDERMDMAECDGATRHRDVIWYKHVVSRVESTSRLSDFIK